MPVHYTVLLLLNAARGCLTEIELMPLDGQAREMHRRWLWIEGSTVTSLEIVHGDQPSEHIFDRAVLTLDGMQGQLLWLDGQCDTLSIDRSGALRPESQRLIHEHLN